MLPSKSNTFSGVKVHCSLPCYTSWHALRN